MHSSNPCIFLPKLPRVNARFAATCYQENGCCEVAQIAQRVGRMLTKRCRASRHGVPRQEPGNALLGRLRLNADGKAEPSRQWVPRREPGNQKVFRVYGRHACPTPATPIFGHPLLLNSVSRRCVQGVGTGARVQIRGGKRFFHSETEEPTTGSFPEPPLRRPWSAEFQNSPMTSSPCEVLRLRQMSSRILSEKNRVEPSHRAAWTPPGCRLREAMIMGRPPAETQVQGGLAG